MKSYSILLSILVFLACSDGPKVNNADLIIRNGMIYLKTSAEPFTGVGVSYFGGGGLKSEDRYKNGYSHGSSYTYFLGGNKKTEDEWNDGARVSYTTWYLTGDVHQQMNFTGYETGLLETWWPNGKQKNIYSVERGRVVPGSSTEWDMFGKELK